MKALKLLFMALAVVVTSCYFFPFVPAVLPMANSKMILAVVGLVFLGINLTKKGNASVDNKFLILSVWALAISLIAFVSITINHTPDDTFSMYFMSMWVWLGGAYAVITLIKSIHGGVSVPLVANYLLAVCVIQCVLALVFDNSAAAEEWHSRTFAGEAFMGNTDEDRLHGIGCSLDVAGFRFAAVICIAAFLLCRNFSRQSLWLSTFYLSAICFITIIGNMIARSTIIGSALALVYIVFISLAKKENRELVVYLSLLAACTTLICVYFYNNDPVFKQNIRFGFEGFFSLAETGEWKTNSNEILKNMVVWPDNLKTWIIGDGYFNNPADKTLATFDPYYVGEYFGGFYKGTDIGYLRYIFYFGVTGLIAFSGFLIYVSKVCIDRFKAFRWMFLMLLALNFIEWFKVSTDLFMVFAPFLCISAEENSEYMRRTEDS
jgi:hypothetical protein BACCOPRO_03218